MGPLKGAPARGRYLIRSAAWLFLALAYLAALGVPPQRWVIGSLFSGALVAFVAEYFPLRNCRLPVRLAAVYVAVVGGAGLFIIVDIIRRPELDPSVLQHSALILALSLLFIAALDGSREREVEGQIFLRSATTAFLVSMLVGGIWLFADSHMALPSIAPATVWFLVGATWVLAAVGWRYRLTK